MSVLTNRRFRGAIARLFQRSSLRRDDDAVAEAIRITRDAVPVRCRPRLVTVERRAGRRPPSQPCRRIARTAPGRIGDEVLVAKCGGTDLDRP